MRRRPYRQVVWALGICLAAALAAAPLAAQPNGQKPPTPQERRQALKPVYLALQSDPQFLNFRQQLAARPNDAALIENFLKFLPLSPLDFAQIDMDVRHYEMAVSREIYEAHTRWVQLHETKARQLYGDAQVDRVLSGWPAEPPETGAAAKSAPLQNIAESATTGTNRNLASTDVPSPLDYQGEIQVVVNPHNANQIVAAANTWDAPTGCQQTQAIFYSSDGGATWNYTCAPGASA
ncbi:MAG TPA: hypothetical protein VF660_00660, partial [Actinomycetota bacterium]